MKLNNLNDLLVHELKDIYSAEHQITKALPLMIDAAASDNLRAAFEEHLKETEAQIKRLDSVFKLMGEKAEAEHCKAMEGIIKEANAMMQERADQSVMDAALIASAQRVEHYEIAAYGTVCTYAKQLGLTEVANLLATTLEEEKATDVKLTSIAESSVNLKAEH